MKVVLREDREGVSEVVGTILILAMTVVLFSTVILWVGAFPTPNPLVHADFQGQLTPIYNAQGFVAGVNITVLHGGGEALQPVPTEVFVTDQRGNGAPSTQVLTLHLYNPRLITPNGLLDGSDSIWDIGERWGYLSKTDLPTDNITVTIIDTSKSAVVWSSPLNSAAGSRPPIISDIWTNGFPSNPVPQPVQETHGFVVYAKVTDPDGDLNPNSVTATITAWFGSNSVCAQPLPMNDAGVQWDAVPGDGIFSLNNTPCTNSPYPAMGWSGTFIIITAADLAGHKVTSRFVLNVAPNTTGGVFSNQTIPSALWQYIGFVQVRAAQVWVSNLGLPYSTNVTFTPYRIDHTTLNANGGPLFHIAASNHGNRTIWVDGWTLITFSKETSASVFSMSIVKPVSPSVPCNAGGCAAYPGNPTNINDFEWAQVFDINPFNQETGGAPVQLLMAAKTPFKDDWPLSFQSNGLFLTVLISGIEGPLNMTYSQILLRWGPTYNPFNHLTDKDPSTRTFWYAQVIPFIGMTVY